MRKLILISALLLASASAHAEHISALNTVDAQPVAVPAHSTPQPLPSAAKDDKTDSAKPQANEPAAQPRAPKARSQTRRYDEDEAKARRIAAKYGISW
jgi:hypothetical protein